ncbi:hypothetical protein FB446DRAFT_846539 [Lentinula raphanica]|nr:hypothetical protein FB446DRAFT_846539 [Lentinula raphanica]
MLGFSAFSASVHRPHRGFRLKAYGPAILLVLGLFSLACAGPLPAGPGGGEVARTGTESSVDASGRTKIWGEIPFELSSSTYTLDYGGLVATPKDPQPPGKVKDRLADMFFERVGLRVAKPVGMPKLDKDDKIHVVLLSESGKKVLQAEFWVTWKRLKTRDDAIYSLMDANVQGVEIEGVIRDYDNPTEVYLSLLMVRPEPLLSLTYTPDYVNVNGPKLVPIRSSYLSQPTLNSRKSVVARFFDEAHIRTTAEAIEDPKMAIDNKIHVVLNRTPSIPVMEAEIWMAWAHSGDRAGAMYRKGMDSLDKNTHVEGIIHEYNKPDNVYFRLEKGKVTIDRLKDIQV